MSKIQDALSKIQGKRPPGPNFSTESIDSEDTVVLARVVDQKAQVVGIEHPGKELHIDRDALRQAEMIAPDYHEQLLANQYRDIKRPLISTAIGKRSTNVEFGNLIMISSALSGEGKTFTSINLVMSIAQERDTSVVLVDADVAKPSTSEMFGVAEEPGLLDLLENHDLPLGSVLLPTDIDGLTILPAGKPRPNATELLSSTRMENICADLCKMNQSQIVILDSPPLLQTSESKVLAELAGQIVLVVKAEETARDAVRGALEILDESKAVNLVLNQARVGLGNYQYGYGYGYSTESTYGKSSEDSSRS